MSTLSMIESFLSGIIYCCTAVIVFKGNLLLQAILQLNSLFLLRTSNFYTKYINNMYSIPSSPFCRL